MSSNTVVLTQRKKQKLGLIKKISRASSWDVAQYETKLIQEIAGSIRATRFNLVLVRVLWFSLSDNP